MRPIPNEATLCLFSTADGRIGIRLDSADMPLYLGAESHRACAEIDVLNLVVERGAPAPFSSMAELQRVLHGDLRLRLKHGTHPIEESP